MLVNADGGSADDTGEVVVETEPPDYVSEMVLSTPQPPTRKPPGPTLDGAPGKGAALRTLFEMAAE